MTVEQKCSYLWKPALSLVIFFLVTSHASPLQDTSSLCPQACTCNATHAKCTSLSGLIKFNSSGMESRFESLDLSNSSLRRITSHLEKFSNLTEIDLSHNRLSEVNKLPRGVRVLNLSHNRITSAKLARIPKSVEHLNISNNHITYVPYHLKTLKNLRTINLSGNPINCSCDTLDVRNWMSVNHVWMDKHVVCTAPLKFKGRPWAQVKQADVCEYKAAASVASKYNWDEIEQNELMQADQAEGSGDDTEPVVEQEKAVGDDDEDYEVPEEATKATSDTLLDGSTNDSNEYGDEDEYDDDDWNKGETIEKDNLLPVSSEPSSTARMDDEEEGSGGGFSPVLIDVNPNSSTTQDDDDASTPHADPDLYYPEDDHSSTGDPTLGTLGIFGVGVEFSSTTPIPPPVPRDDFSPAPPPEDSTDDSETIAPPLEVPNQDVKQAAQNDNRSTFILLGILGVILIALMIYVAVKDKGSKRNRKGKRDIENTPAQELQDMVKPPPTNGRTEHSPLVPDSPDIKANGHDKFPAISPEKIPEEPEEEEKLPMSTFKPDPQIQVPHETNNNYPLQQNGDLPEVHKEVPLQSKRYSPVYSPRTPKLDRYSPVYTPEGRVKIKLTETPKPKTPIMVNRTRSRAGELVITTPEVIIDPVPNSSPEVQSH